MQKNNIILNTCYLFLKKIKYKTNFLIKDINSAAKYIKQSYKGHTESDF